MSTTMSTQSELMVCTTGKKPYLNEGDAVAFAQRLLSLHPDEPLQRAYKCHDCGLFHLTSKPIESVSLAQTNYEEIGKYDVRERRQTPEERLETQQKAIALTNSGMAAKDIAEQLNISIQRVYNIRAGKDTGMETSLAGIEIKKQSIQEQIAALQKELEVEEQRKQWVLEQQTLQAKWIEDVNGEKMLLLTQNNNKFTILPEDAKKLFTLLQARLAELK
jgi:transposase